MIKRVNFTLLLIISIYSCQPRQERNAVIIYNAASTTDLVEKLSSLYESEYWTDVKFSPAGSGTLIRQIELGASAGLFISASKQWLDYGEERSLYLSHNEFLQNRLAIITPINSHIESIREYEGIVALGDPSYVPAGFYAKEFLVNTYQWEEISRRVNLTTDVRKALSLIELGEIEVGIVYLTDAKKSDKVKIIEIIDEKLHTPIYYYIALLKGATDAEKKFYNFLTTDERVGEQLNDFGFQTIERDRDD